jgi:hypothetical protein
VVSAGLAGFGWAATAAPVDSVAPVSANNKRNLTLLIGGKSSFDERAPPEAHDD